MRYLCKSCYVNTGTFLVLLINKILLRENKSRHIGFSAPDMLESDQNFLAPVERTLSTALGSRSSYTKLEVTWRSQLQATLIPFDNGDEVVRPL